MRKIAALVGAGAMLLSAAVPAFGAWNFAWVNNSSGANSITGSNNQNSSAGVSSSGLSVANTWGTGARTVVTGDACAHSTAVTVANTNVFSGPAMNTAFVSNDSFAGASTGQNNQSDSSSVTGSFWSTANTGSTGDRVTTTGDAGAVSNAWTVVNTNVVTW